MVSANPATKKTTTTKTTTTTTAKASAARAAPGGKATTSAAASKASAPKAGGAAAGGAAASGGNRVKQQTENYECPVCLELCADPVLTPCKHFMCFACSKAVIKSGMTCPMCRAHFDRNFIPSVDKTL